MENKNEFQLSQAAFEALAENALDAILIVNAQATCIYANRAFYQLFGGDYEKKEYLGTSGTRFWREQDIPFLMETIVPQAMSGGWSGEVKNLRTDGALLDIQGAAFAIREADGKSLGMAVTMRDITARKKLEAAAHEALERLNTVINNLPVVLFVLDRNGIFTLSEGKALALTGNKPGRVVGMSAFDVYRSLPGVNDYLKRALAGEAFNVEIPMGPFIFDTSFSPVRDANGEFLGTIGLSMDVSSRKKYEAETRRLVSVVESTSDMIAVTDLQGRVLYINPSGLDMVGRTGQDFRTLSIPDFHPPEVAQKIQEEHLPVVMQKGTHRWEAELLHVDGHRIPVSQIASLIVGQDGKPEGLTTTIRDITAAKQAESALRDEKDFTNAVLESLPGVFYLYDTAGRLMRWNRNYGIVIEASDAEMDHSNVMDNIAEEDRELIAERMQKVFNEGQAEAEADLISRSGKRMSYYFTGRRLIMGSQAYLAGIGLDISARKQAEAEARRLQEQVIEAQRHALQELSTPIIPVLDRIIVMPLIGSIDTLRAKDITRALLAGISQYRAKIVIVDITGVPIVDSGVADHLNKTIQAARLKGAQTIVTGMSDAVAEAIIDLGIDWSNIQTLSDLQTGLMVAISTLGLKLSR
jgi:rsbT co-antagonist protein RsbR